MRLYLFFFKLLMIPETVIILNPISTCIAYKSVPYKRLVMLFWRNNFLLWVFVCLSCISFRQYFQINIVKSGAFGIKRGLIIGVVYKRWEFKASAHYELITRFFYDCTCLVYCLFFRLVANKYVHLCLNWSKSVHGGSRFHRNEKQALK